jgi:glycerophosphoryl diester phosphodiesterase
METTKKARPHDFIYFLIIFSTFLFSSPGLYAREDLPDRNAALSTEQSIDALPSRGLCAHRGAMATYPENTLPAFREAVRLGVAMIEMDARLTADSQLVILHDQTVDRTTDGTGRLGDLTLAEVKRLDAGSWKSPAFAGTRIPTLEEALAVIPPDILINVHVKEGPEVSSRVATLIVRMHREHQAFIACDTAAAAAVRRISPGIMICNMERLNSTKEYVSLTIRAHSDFIQFYKTPADDTLRSFCHQLKKQGIRINYYRGDSVEEVRRLWDLGVDFVLVNDPAAILKGLREQRSPEVP